jgi:hypothetical protein
MYPRIRTLKSLQQSLPLWFIVLQKVAKISRHFITKKIGAPENCKKAENKWAYLGSIEENQDKAKEVKVIESSKKELEKSGRGQFRTIIKWNTMADFIWYFGN